MNETWKFLNTNKVLESIMAKGVLYKVGDRVRVQPKGRADIMDMAIAGKTAVIESIEQDFEDRIYLALVVDEDPSKEHCFFYSPEEVQRLKPDS